jgi:type VI secretion system protein ImpM
MSHEVIQSPGFYGKLPNLGDFVSRRLPAEFIKPWDLWLQESLAESRVRLGDEWLATYLTSPLWRFVLTPGIAGQTGWAGVMMPSVDRVGRYFPLTLASPLGISGDPLRLLGETAWFDRLETVMLTGLDESSSIEAFDVQVQGLGSPPSAARPCAQVSALGQARSNAWRIQAPSPAELSGRCSILLSLALDQVFCAYSLWWSSGSERVAPSGLICQGLPPTEGFSGLLAGDWAGGGWWDLDCPGPARAMGESR